MGSYSGTKKYDFLQVINYVADAFGRNDRYKITITYDKDEIENWGKVSIYNFELKKYHKVIQCDLKFLFPSENPPNGEDSDGLPKIVSEAAKKLIHIAIIMT